MDAGYQDLKRLFLAACELSAAERGPFLDRNCPDAELRRQVDELLAADAGSADDSLDRAVERTCDGDSAPTAPVPERIGAYRVLRVCGVGGMGTVYEAEQTEPARRVAVKVIQRARASGEVLRRFRREAEILSRLRHPGIATNYETGTFEQDGVGRPFLAMEFVDGPDLVTHCRTAELAVDARLRLFLQVCDAIEHAHGQGVVHRDLKPDNILVPTASAPGATPVPKVLDFGVARLSGAGDPRTLATGEGQLIGSLSYMSPEQAGGRSNAVDARSDVYSLGVILFEVLADELPHSVVGLPLAEAVRVICEVDPIRLSSVVPTLRGDLEVIVGKCLEMEPRRRYGSVRALALDLRRYLEGAAIEARPPSTFYVFCKFARRHRALVGGSLVAFVALALGLVVSILFAFRAAENERVALREARRARLAAAAALVDGDPLAAERTLQAIPGAQRGWEWRHLDSRLRCHDLDLGASFPESPLCALAGGARVLLAADARRLREYDTTTGDVVAEWAAPDDAAAWAVAADGSRFAAGLADGRVFVAPRNGAVDWHLWRECGAAPGQLAFSRDGAELAIVSGATLAIGDLTRGFRTCRLDRTDRRYRIAFSPSGDRIAAIATTGGGILVLAAHDLSQLGRRHDQDDARALAWRGDNLVLGMLQRTVDVYSAASLQPIARLAGHTRGVVSVEVGDDGSLISASEDGTVRVWSPNDDGHRVFVHPGVRRASFLGRGRVVTSSPESVRVWNLDGAAVRVLRGHHSYVYEVAFSADSSLVTSHVPFEPYELFTWEARSGAKVLSRPGPWKSAALTFDGQGGCVTGQGTSLAVWPWWSTGNPVQGSDRSLHLTLDREGRLRASDAPCDIDARALTERHALRVEHRLGVRSETPRLSIDGRAIDVTPTAGDASTVGPNPRLFVGNAGITYARFEGAIVDLIVFGDHLEPADATGVDDYLARRRRGEAAALSGLRAPLLAHFRADPEFVQCIDGTDHVAGWSACNDPSLRLLPLGQGNRRVRFCAAEPGAAASVEFGRGPQLDGWLETALPGVRDRARITVCLLGAWSSERTLWSRAPYGILTPALVGPGSHQPDVSGRRIGSTVSLSADGRRRVATEAYHGGTVRVRDTATGRVLRRLGDDGMAWWGVDIHPGGDRVAAGNAAGQVVAWDVDSGRELASITAHDGAVYAVAWSPDGSRVATGGNDNSIRIWDAEHFELLLELRGHELYVKALAWSPDGTMLASASGDRTVRLWDSVPARARLEQRNAAARLEAEVRPQVEAWRRDLADLDAVGDRVRRTYAGDDARRLAAFRLLARGR